MRVPHDVHVVAGHQEEVRVLRLEPEEHLVANDGIGQELLVAVVWKGNLGPML
jgi:hypothetical protein